MADTLIPVTDTPGAKDISAHLFALMMIDDCYNPSQQKDFVDGLIAFEKDCDKKFNQPFFSCTSAERKTLLSEVEKSNSFFYTHYKKLVVQAFTSSQFFVTKIQKYELIPSRYHGCVPVKIIA